MFVAGDYDVIVIGLGHAGCEAALAAARLGCRTLAVTLNLENVALMPCNPAVGGPAKGHLVREIDALGGQMGLNTDATALQMRMLNTGKGPAVHALRAQSDKKLYQQEMKFTLENQDNLDIKQLMVQRLLVEHDRVTGIVAESGALYRAAAVVLATGTYLRGRIIIGEVSYSGGPNGQRAAQSLSADLQRLGLSLMRFKTGTPARVDRRSLDFSRMICQPGDEEPHNFSFLSDVVTRHQEPCWLTYTNEHTHDIIRRNLSRAPMFTGAIEGTGPRYCPAIESKVVRFADKHAHQVFIEPEGRRTMEMYVQGMSTSMPVEVQEEFLRTIAGMERVRIMRAGYAIEYDCLDPLQLTPALAHKSIAGLFTAGQANGTSGYEEAAAQGLMAGINAARLVQGKEPFILSRADAYIGVLIDDLVTKGTNEPYRIMTSRAEYRLLLRHDNADLRLTEKGWRLGLVTPARYRRFTEKKQAVEQALALLAATPLNPEAAVQQRLQALGSAPLKSGISLAELLRRPEITYTMLEKNFGAPPFPAPVREQVEIAVKYEGYIAKQQQQVERMNKLEGKLLSPDLDYEHVSGLSAEGRQKLARIQPRSLGQAARISGVSPADIAVLLVYVTRRQRGGGAGGV